MTVYVDDMYRYPMGRYGRMKMSHLVADSEAELLAMADKIGLARRWIQHPGMGRGFVHFDSFDGLSRTGDHEAGAAPLESASPGAYDSAVETRRFETPARKERTKDVTQPSPIDWKPRPRS